MDEENNIINNQENNNIESSIINEPVKENIIVSDNVSNNVETVSSEVATNEIDKTQIKENTEVEIKDKKPINKKLLFIIIGALIAIITVVVIIIIVVNKKSEDSKSFKDPFIGFSAEGFEEISGGSSLASKYKDIDYQTIIQKGDQLKQDLDDGTITPNEYIKQLAYKVYGDKKLVSKYKNSDIYFPDMESFYSEVLKYSDKIEPDVAVYILKKIYLMDYKLESDNNKQLSNQGSDYKVTELKNTNDSTIYTLNKVRLSKDGHFLIYYATRGNVAVTEKYVDSVDKSLELGVKKYEELYKVPFKYEYHPNLSPLGITPVNEDIHLKAATLLTINGISTDYIFKAMPVYIIETGDNILGQYVKFDNSYNDAMNQLISTASKMITIGCTNPVNNSVKDFCLDIFGDGTSSHAMAATTYSFPYFNIDYNLNEQSSIDFVTLHELFHHYQRYICGNGEYKECASKLFTMETSANIAAIHAKSLDYSIINNHYVSYYLPDVERSIDKVGLTVGGDTTLGYGAYVFAYNYINIVPDGFKKFNNSINKLTPILYLYNEAGDKYKDVMMTLAEKNLTHDYDKIALLPLNDKNNLVNPPAHLRINPSTSDYSNKETISYSSIHYYYIDNVNQFNGKQQLSFNSDSKDVSLILFGKVNGQYKVLHKHDFSSEFTINISDFKDCSSLAIAIVDYNSRNFDNYTIEYKNEGNKTATIGTIDEHKKIDDKKSGIGVTEAELVRAKAIYCKKNEPNSTSMTQTSEVLVNYKDSTKIKDMYVKETLDINGLDVSSPTYNLAKQLLDASFQGIEQLFNLYFKQAKTIYEKKETKYSLTVKIPQNYFDNLGDVYNFEGNRKIDIVNGLTEEGFTCYLRY